MTVDRLPDDMEQGAVVVEIAPGLAYAFNPAPPYIFAGLYEAENLAARPPCDHHVRAYVADRLMREGFMQSSVRFCDHCRQMHGHTWATKAATGATIYLCDECFPPAELVRQGSLSQEAINRFRV